MAEHEAKMTILVADDDPDDRLLIDEAFTENGLTNPVHSVCDGEQLMDYLQRRGEYAGLAGEPYPGLILLDLNMPKKDGRAALKEIKEDPDLQRIPVVVLTTSSSEEDVVRTYTLGVSSFITKPPQFHELCDLVRTLSRYWGEMVALPPECRVK